jgi:hypothetical protein
MSESHRRTLPLAVTILEGLLALWCLGLIVFGGRRISENLGLACLVVGIVGLILVGVSVSIVWMLAQLPERSGMGSEGPRAKPSEGSNAERLLSQIYENSMLSDTAKRVLFRDRELQLLRRAIEEDIAHGDYNSGLTLCDDLANLFGHREEAENFRTRILQAGHASFEAKVHSALDQFEQILATRDWARAHRDAARIRRLFPNHHLVQDIDQRILRARDEHKQELESRFLDAANRDDVESAMALLKELDRYLTRDEAARIAEIAQGVVFKHRENLSMQFKLAVNDHRWAEAAQFGDAIISEYPNTKMADEVRSMIDVLRVRATQAAVLSQG